MMSLEDLFILFVLTEQKYIYFKTHADVGPTISGAGAGHLSLEFTIIWSGVLGFTKVY